MRRTLGLALTTTLIVGPLAGVAAASPTTITARTASTWASNGAPTSAPATAEVDPEVTRTLASLAPGELTTVVVTMRAQADLDAVSGGSRAVRLRGVERALHATARVSQDSIRALLDGWAAQGKVAETTPLWIVNGISVTATRGVIEGLAARSDVASITSDEVTVVPTAGPAEPNIAAVSAPAMWDLGQTGQGVVVATLDSGVDVSHPDLASRWRGGTNSWYDPYGQHPTTPTDLTGHGTATTGVMVGGDAGGTSIGMAPGATWIAAKIFNDQGASTSTAIHQAFQWVLDPDHDPGTNDAPQVVNGSWSIGSGPSCDLSYQPDLQALRAAGILPVFAAGNFGSGVSTSVSPANYPEAVAVGAVSNAGLVYSASSRGPSTCGGRTAIFPDLVAPGVGIVTTDRYGFYQTVSGTSLSAPHVAGALALLLGAVPGLSVDRQLAALTSTADDLGPLGPDTSYGNGRLDVAAAFQWLTAAPEFGMSLTPTAASLFPGGGTTHTVQITPVNGFAADVSVSLSGLTAEQASWSFTPSVVTAGSGTSQLSITASATIPPGSYPLTVTATSGALTHSVPLTLTVNAPPDFSVAAAPALATVNAGSPATSTVSVGALNGFTGTVTLSATGLPVGVGTATVTPATLAGSGTALLNMTTVTTAPGGTYPITVTATSGTTVHTATVSLTVQSRDFALSTTLPSASVARGGVVTFPISVAALGGFTGKVKLTRTGVPSKGSTSWTLNPVVVPGSSGLRVKTSTLTPRGNYTLVITGTSGYVSHQLFVVLTVT